MAEQKIDININEEVAAGIYSNFSIITHSNAEFIIDFAAMMPGMPKGTVRSRIVMTPQNAKRLLNALADNLAKYEEKNGVITENRPDTIPIIGGNGGLA
ncbi:MAG: DUF3467 domain-containing protein [Bacteroidales bacterium]|nr:DUF3467 domain-containing protein [Bacteroidales bacterium]